MYFGIPIDNWESLTSDRGQWRAAIYRGAELFEAAKLGRAKLRRACQKCEILLANSGDVWICEECDWALLSKAGLVNHMKSHESYPTAIVVSTMPHSDSQHDPHEGILCSCCTKVCRTAGGLKLHMKVYTDAYTTPVDSVNTDRYVCQICSKLCKTLTGLKSHQRAH